MSDKSNQQPTNDHSGSHHQAGGLEPYRPGQMQPGVMSNGMGVNRPAQPVRGSNEVGPDGQGLFSNTVQMMKRLSGKMVTVNKDFYVPPPPPMELYHPSEIVRSDSARQQTWRRSRALRTSIRMKRRRERL